MNNLDSYDETTEEEYKLLRKASIRTSLRMLESLFGNTRLAEMIRAFSAITISLKIDYFVIGGLAFGLWGRTRSTFDADIIAVVSGDKQDKLLNALSLVGFKVRKGDLRS